MSLDVHFNQIVIVSTIFDALMAVAVLRCYRERGLDGALRRPARLGLRPLARAAALWAAVFLLKVPVGEALGVHRFGWIYLLYADLVVMVPALGLGLLAVARLSPLARTVAVVSLALIPVGVYATFIEPFDLRLETAKLPVSERRAGSGVVTIGVLTDLQTLRVGDYEHRAVARLMAERPDVVLLPGDIFQGTRAQFDATKSALMDLLATLQAPGGVYLVLGDTDHGADRLLEILGGTHIRLLVNQIARVTVNGRQLTIGGIELDYTSVAARRLVERLETEEGGDDVRILCAHRPDAALGLKPSSRIDLVVAGHTHGGQIVVPGFGPPMTLSGVPRAVAAGGLHRIEKNPIYVSRGVGCERGQAPRVRFLCPPEVSLLRLGGLP